MNKSIVTIEYDIYEPEFNPDTGEYEDKSPYRKYQRKMFECRCSAGTYLKNNTQFKQHIRSQTHQNYIENYTFFRKEILEEQELNKKLKYDNEILERKNNKIEKEYEILKLINIKLCKHFIKYCDKNQKAHDKFKKQLNEMLIE